MEMEMEMLHSKVMCFLVVLSVFCYFDLCRGCSHDERRALEDIIASMGIQFESSSYSDDCCEWEGVDCSLTSFHVTRIDFQNAREKEADPWFPDMELFGQIKELNELNLVGNLIESLLNPEELCKLENLQHLDLSCNSIESDMPSCLVNMSSLRILKLAKNQFQGDLSILGNLSNIGIIDVSHNHFQGRIPLSIFANLSKLSYLDLSYNPQLEVDSESPNWQPFFEIQHLFLAGCNLNKESGHVIPRFISTQTNLKSLDLSNNFLGGSFPSWMLHKVSTVLSLRGNAFVGQFPREIVPSTLVELDISCNYFHGTLPQNISFLFPNLRRFNVSSSRFSGTIPPSVGYLQNLEQLDLSNNLFSGVIPKELTENSPLWYLNLSNNSLSGDLLPKDCNMKNLSWLLLHHNGFIGNMPTCLSNSPSLWLLDVRHNMLSGEISRKMSVFSELGAFLLRGNRFTGLIPTRLCQAESLQFFDLSSNGFSESIPSCLSKNLFWRKKSRASSWVPIDFTTKFQTYSFMGIPLTMMTGMDLSGNRLTGPIPVQFGELQELVSVNLSNNSLTGHIPTSFKNLKNLESLDLSHNRLTGHIPPEFTQMSFLEVFSVAFNDLSGRIPFSEQSITFPEGSYIGNLKLCGDPLPGDCSDIDKKKDDKKEGRSKDHIDVMDEPLFFYSFVFVSYALGFWFVVAPLCLSRTWRRKYYTTLHKWVNCWCWKSGFGSPMWA